MRLLPILIVLAVLAYAAISIIKYLGLLFTFVILFSGFTILMSVKLYNHARNPNG